MIYYPKNTLITPLILFSLIAVMIVYWWGYGSPAVGVDDANIYFVYMRHLAEGHGFIWNAGGERVEGFTSLIWVLFGALAYGISPAYFNMILLGANFLLIFFALRNLLLFSRRLNHTEDQPITATDIVIISLLVFPLGFIEWQIIALMETGLWTFLILQLTLQLCSFYVKDRGFNIYKFSIMIVLLDLTRPESMVLSLVFIGILFFILAESGWANTWKMTSVPLILHIATLASITAWRLSYFGYPLPNTFYAKVSGSFLGNIPSGARYLLRFFYWYPHAAVASGILVLCFVLLVKRLREKGRGIHKEDKVMVILLIVISAGLALPVFTGGDHFLYSRFYQPYLPLMYLAVTCSFLWTEYIGVSTGPRRVPMIVLALPIVFGALFFSKFTIFDFENNNRTSINYNIILDFYLAKNGRDIGAKLNETFGDSGYPSLGALATGSIAYAYKGKTIDLLGLNNTIMAHASSIKEGPRNHASFDKEGFWKLSPEMMGTFMAVQIVIDTNLFVLPENTTQYRTSNFAYLCYKAIFDDANFRLSYFPALVKNKNTDYFIFAYFRKDFLSSLLDNGNYFVKIIKRKSISSNPTDMISSSVAKKNRLPSSK